VLVGVDALVVEVVVVEVVVVVVLVVVEVVLPPVAAANHLQSPYKKIKYQ
jgi:hypothetical protein